jgi:hypothetical protein
MRLQSVLGVAHRSEDTPTLIVPSPRDVRQNIIRFLKSLECCSRITITAPIGMIVAAIMIETVAPTRNDWGTP